MKVIDFRVRPNYKNNWDSFYDYKGEFIMPEVYREYGLEYKGSVKSQSLEEMLSEIEDNNIVAAVVPAREIGGINNNQLERFVNEYGNGFIPFPFISPLKTEQALATIEHYVTGKAVKGVALEPNFGGSQSYDIDDEAIKPVYERLQELGAIVLLTFSAHGFLGLYADQVERLDRLALNYPELKIVAVHGGWPYTLESIAVAMNRKNVYLTPDCYATDNPGGHDFMRAANTVLQDKIIFSTSYPNLTFKETIDRYKREIKDERILEKILYGNAAKLLGLE